MDKATVTMLLDVMSDEMIYEWSYELRDDTRADAQTLLEIVVEYLADQSLR